MVSVRKMQQGDAKQASKMTKEIMLDCWTKCEKDYYPKKALNFDISVHSPKYYRDSLKLETNFTFVAEETNEIVGIANGRPCRRIWFGKTRLDRCSPNPPKQRNRKSITGKGDRTLQN